MLNANPELMDMLTADCLTELDFRRNKLVDFVQWGVVAADAIYERRLARQQVAYVRNHLGRGSIPLGAELEFSNIGHRVIQDPRGEHIRDAAYDGFLYFPDFGLDVLTWKLGGHVDDHHQKHSTARRRGFFEVALGSLSVQANISKPITSDPWLVGQLIHEARRFYPIAPHSVHISLQLRTQRSTLGDRTLPLYILQCLFAIAGDPVRESDGSVRIRRLTTDEILSGESPPSMLFSDVRKRYSSEGDDSLVRSAAASQHGLYVQQFRFLRLSAHLNYEPIIMGLKGLQLDLSPGSFLKAEQYQHSALHRRLYDRLVAWGRAPTPIRERDIDAFCRHIHSGLMTERRGRPAHSEAYIAWSLAQLRRMLRSYNALFRSDRDEPPEDHE